MDIKVAKTGQSFIRRCSEISSLVMLMSTLMKQVLVIGVICLTFLSFQKEESKKEKRSTNAEKIARDVQRELGTFDAVYSYNDSLGIMYAYHPEGNKTEKVKGIIDKTLNIVGEEATPKSFLNPEYNYEWETSTEKISMRGVYKGSKSYVNIWIYVK
jgi:hypothetical protein